MPPAKRRDPFRRAVLGTLKQPPSREEMDAPLAVPGEFCRCSHLQHNGRCPVRSCGCRFNRPRGEDPDVA